MTTATDTRKQPTDVKNLADLYHLDPIPWSRALEALESNEPRSRRRSSPRPDRTAGRTSPASARIWDSGKVYVVSGDGTRKSKNLARNPTCTVAMSLNGIDLVIEGTAAKVKDDATLHRLAKRYGDQGWPARVEDGAFTYDYSAPSAGPPPWHLYEITPTTVYGVLAAEPGGATRWRF